MDNDRDDKISAYWEDSKTSSMNDKYIATLETEMIRSHIRRGERVLDLGCGDGTGSAGYRVGVGAYFALERSWKMLREFQGLANRVSPSSAATCALCRSLVNR